MAHLPFFLIKLLSKVPMDEALKNVYRQAAHKIEAATDRERAMAAVGMTG